MSTSKNNLFIFEDQSERQIKKLINSNIDLNLIAELKNTEVQFLINFMAVKKISVCNTTSQENNTNHVKGIINNRLGADKSFVNIQKNSDQYSQFTTNPYYKILEADSALPYVGLGYNQNSKEKGKKWKKGKKGKKGKKRKTPWKDNDFPLLKVGDLNYYCADCRNESKAYHCSICKRKCWKWCIICMKYRSNHHCHFNAPSSKKRRRRPWNNEEFPKFNNTKTIYYCADCSKNKNTRLCDCGRDCWKWCNECLSYQSKHHYRLFHRKNKKRKME